MRLYFQILNKLLMLFGLYVVIANYIMEMPMVKQWALKMIVKGWLSNWINFNYIPE